MPNGTGGEVGVAVIGSQRRRVLFSVTSRREPSGMNLARLAEPPEAILRMVARSSRLQIWTD
ncbi:MAG: hypothetical protein P8J87_03365, partial [Verrucomicrobiales bacterium]|nr:hypothetical protein [Verrucomicrobiales bacterium]